MIDEYVVIDNMVLPIPDYSLLYFIQAVSVTCLIAGFLIGFLI